MVKKRFFEESNYKAFFFNGKTLRLPINHGEPITELEYPEFYDVDIFHTMNGLCHGNCPWCYLNGNKDGKYVENAVQKIKDFFEPMSNNQRPFQIALPGSGEFFDHPYWEEILKTFYDLDILPNYTTNGMWVDTTLGEVNRVLNVTKKYCGGVAISCHPHLRKYWEVAAKLYSSNDVKLNFHIIISDINSINYFVDIYNEWKNDIDYFVLLPHGNQGRGIHKEINWEYLLTRLPEDQSKIAFGANFYNYLLKGNHNIQVSLYEPEIMSKFLSLDTMKTHPSSFMIS